MFTLHSLHLLRICRQLRARRALLQLKDVLLRTRRALLLYKVNGNSALLVLNGTSLICNSALLALSWRCHPVITHSPSLLWRRHHVHFFHFIKKLQLVLRWFIQYIRVQNETKNSTDQRTDFRGLKLAFIHIFKTSRNISPCTVQYYYSEYI